ncbi:MAG: NAD(P)-dependent oxidoreductase [Solirubrobacteraceae bacterium]
MKILFLDQNHVILKTKLEASNFTVVEDYSSPINEIEKIINDFDGIVIRSRFPLNEAFLSKATQLKFIGRVGAGLENIDVSYAQTKNIKLINAPEGNCDSLAEHAVGMLLSLTNKIIVSNLEIREGIWNREENRADELFSKTVGLIGYGNMGKAFAKRLSGFGVEVLFYDIKSGLEDNNAKQVSLNDLFEKTHVLSIHTPLTPKTNYLINKDFIANFKKNIYLINTARGKCVNTKDLVDLLKSGKIKGACLDVIEYEKSSFDFINKTEFSNDFNYLLHSEKVILTPHIAGWSIQNKKNLAEIIANKIIKDFFTTIK